MNGSLAKLMAKTDPKLYRKYLVNEKGKKVLYLHLQKALYGMMKSALLFYQKLVSKLRSIVDGNQLTLQWHVNDLMISHINVSAINEFL